MRIAVSDVHGGLTQFSPLQALCHRIVCAQVNNPFAAAEFILPAGVTACLAQALHLVCLLLVLFRRVVGWGTPHSPLLPQTAVAWTLQDSRALLPVLGWKNTCKSLLSFPGKQTSSREKEEEMSSFCCLKKTEGGTKEKHLQKHGK